MSEYVAKPRGAGQAPAARAGAGGVAEGWQAALQRAPGVQALAQLREALNGNPATEGPAPAANRTGLPDSLKSSIESLSGVSLDAARVHYNSPKPAQLNALAFAQGTEIHVAPGQERHVPHEAWHLVQQAQGRVQATKQLRGGVPVNDDRALESEAEAMGGLAARSGGAPAPAPETGRGLRGGPAQAVQRVIAGLEEYTAPASIPGNWVEAYGDDIAEPVTHLTDGDLLLLYGLVRPGRTPDEDGVHFENAGGDHWNVVIGGTTYQTRPDGSCAIHAVELANRVLEGHAPDPDTPYAAPADVVAERREQIADDIRGNPDEIRRIIAERIQDSDYVATTGFGPALMRLLEEASIVRSPQDAVNFFDINYAQLRWRDLNLPKPSQARAILQAEDFFTRAFASPLEMMRSALETIHAKSVSGAGMSFGDETYTRMLNSAMGKSLPIFREGREARAGLSKIGKAPRKAPGRRKHRLPGGRLLPAELRAILETKLRKKSFVRKLMRAAKGGGEALERQFPEIAELVRGGQVDLSELGHLSSGQKFAAFSSFRDRKSREKKDLQFGLGTGGKASFGAGGFQVKGLGTYPGEIGWYMEHRKNWKCSDAELFGAMQEKNYEELLRLTGNAGDAGHLMRFENLQILERWRAAPFGTGVATWARVGYHGGTNLPGYMSSMPMYEPNATTNVTRTEDPEAPYDEALFARQQASTVEGIRQLMNIEIGEGEVYDEGSAAYLRSLAMEPEEGEDPSEAVIEASSRMIQSPNPYQNEDSDGDGDA